MKVVLDCNIIISFLINPGQNIKKIKEAWQKDTFELLISDEILSEIKEVLYRLQIKGYFGQNESGALFRLLLRKSTLIKVIAITNTSIDKKDNRYLSCAKDGKAHYLITGDLSDLIPLKKYKYTRILTASEFSLILSSLPYRIN